MIRHGVYSDENVFFVALNYVPVSKYNMRPKILNVYGSADEAKAAEWNGNDAVYDVPVRPWLDAFLTWDEVNAYHALANAS